jgi:hypothetical protein
MAHYFFDTRDNGTFIRDDVGLEFDTIEEARDEAAVCLAKPGLRAAVTDPRSPDCAALTSLFVQRWRSGA